MLAIFIPQRAFIMCDPKKYIIEFKISKRVPLFFNSARRFMYMLLV